MVAFTDVAFTVLEPYNSFFVVFSFLSLDRDRVIGVIELADKVASSPTDVGTFTR